MRMNDKNNRDGQILIHPFYFSRFVFHRICAGNQTGWWYSGDWLAPGEEKQSHDGISYESLRLLADAKFIFE